MGSRFRRCCCRHVGAGRTEHIIGATGQCNVFRVGSKQLGVDRGVIHQPGLGQEIVGPGRAHQQEVAGQAVQGVAPLVDRLLVRLVVIGVAVGHAGHGFGLGRHFLQVGEIASGTAEWIVGPRYWASVTRAPSTATFSSCVSSAEWLFASCANAPSTSSPINSKPLNHFVFGSNSRGSPIVPPYRFMSGARTRSRLRRGCAAAWNPFYGGKSSETLGSRRSGSDSLDFHQRAGQWQGHDLQGGARGFVRLLWCAEELRVTGLQAGEIELAAGLFGAD